MNDKELQDLFGDTTSVPIDQSAKSKAISIAMNEFQALHAESSTDSTQEAVTQELTKNGKTSQGFLSFFRPTYKSEEDSGSNLMQLLNQKWFLGGMASGCAMLFGGIIFYNMAKPEVFHSSDSSAPVIEIAGEDYALADDMVLEEAYTAPNAYDTSKTGNVEKLARPEKVTTEALTAPAPNVRGRVVSSEVAASELAADIGHFPNEAVAKNLQRLAGAPAAVEYGVDGFVDHGFQEQGRNKFKSFEQNSVKRTVDEPVSTFSIDVDTASYSFVRRQLNRGLLPSKNAVRLEEMLNYFDYNYPLPKNKSQPFQASVSVLDSPWKEGNQLVHIGIKGYEIVANKKPKVNLVFLLDVSGSMNSPDKLPLVKQSMHLLLSQLSEEDTVAIAVYAGAAGTVLEPTAVKEKHKILAALDKLQAGGSTAGAQGLKLAYQLAEQNFDKEAVNRIILATDGDFNVGISDREELKSYVERKRDSGVFLSVLGFGDGNYQDHLMQALAQNGNGVAAYIDTLSEAQKVLVNEAFASLFPIAKDVKIQVEFNPNSVAEYRLLGYETRQLAREDFNNDAVDAGEIGSGHSVTAVYEITPVGASSALISESRYKQNNKARTAKGEHANELGYLKIRYKLPDESTSKLISKPILKAEQDLPALLESEVQFGVAVVGFAELLRDSKYVYNWSYDDAIALAHKHKGEDEYGYRTEFVQLIRKAKIAKEL